MKVKQLEWAIQSDTCDDATTIDTAVALTDIGDFDIYKTENLFVYRTSIGSDFYSILGAASTFEEAKAKCQQELERLINTCIEEEQP